MTTLVLDDMWDPWGAVDRGLAFLDKSVPGWRQDVPVETLDIADTKRCVLGELFGTYGEGLRKLGLTDEQAANLGFTVPAYFVDPQKRELFFKDLTHRWREMLSIGPNREPSWLHQAVSPCRVGRPLSAQ